jgi:hypothetical protein
MDEYDDSEMAANYADMDEFYNRKYDVKCKACGLEQTSTEHLLREIGWTLENGTELCFQAKCIRDRQVRGISLEERNAIYERTGGCFGPDPDAYGLAIQAAEAR